MVLPTRYSRCNRAAVRARGIAQNDDAKRSANSHRLDRCRSDGLPDRRAPARRRLRRLRSGTAPARRRSRSPAGRHHRRLARRSGRPRHRVHDGGRLGRLQAGGHRTRPACCHAADVAPAVIVDSSTVSPEASAAVRAGRERRGTALLAAPVSGNPKVVAAGRLTVVASGPAPRLRPRAPVPGAVRRAVSPTSARAMRARLVKICHNLFLGVVAQSLAEIAVLAEKGGVARREFFGFINAERDGLDVHPLQDPGVRQPRATRRRSRPSCCARTSTWASMAADELGVPLRTMRVVRSLVQEADRRRLHGRRLRGADRARGRRRRSRAGRRPRPGRRRAGRPQPRRR